MDELALERSAESSDAIRRERISTDIGKACFWTYCVYDECRVGVLLTPIGVVPRKCILLSSPCTVQIILYRRVRTKAFLFVPNTRT